MLVAMAERWKLEVEHAMGCNCNWGCPCGFESPPTYGSCEAAMAWRVLRGTYGHFKLDGLAWVLAAIWPGPLHQRNGRGVVFLDDSASSGQSDALRDIATGSAGGPIGIFMSTVNAGIEVKSARISYTGEGKTTAFSIGDEVDVEFEPILNPVSGLEHHVSLLLHTGMLNKREHFFSTKTLKVITDGMHFSYPGRNGFTSQTVWEGP